MYFYTSLLCHLFKVEYRVHLLKRINRLNYSFPKSRENNFPQDSEVVAALLRGFNYLYKVSVYQIKFDWSQASRPIGTTILPGTVRNALFSIFLIFFFSFKT
jgi:hypothetical protein